MPSPVKITEDTERNQKISLYFMDLMADIQLLLLFKHITCASNRMYQLPPETLVNLVAQVIDVYINNIRIKVKLLVVYMLGNLCPAYYIALAVGKIFQYYILPCRQWNNPVAPFYFMACSVYLKVCDTYDSLLHLSLPAQKRPYPRKELAEVKGFCKIVIRSGIKPRSEEHTSELQSQSNLL